MQYVPYLDYNSFPHLLSYLLAINIRNDHSFPRELVGDLFGLINELIFVY